MYYRKKKSEFSQIYLNRKSIKENSRSYLLINKYSFCTWAHKLSEVWRKKSTLFLNLTLWSSLKLTSNSENTSKSSRYFYFCMNWLNFLQFNWLLTDFKFTFSILGCNWVMPPPCMRHLRNIVIKNCAWLSLENWDMEHRLPAARRLNQCRKMHIIVQL